MLRILKDLDGYSVRATDGNIGTVVDVLLDDERWTIRYLVVDTGGVLTGRRVLISPIAFREADWATHSVHVALTVDQVRNSPSFDTDMPVSRWQERLYNRYYQYPYYWGYSNIWGMSSFPDLLGQEPWLEKPEQEASESGDVHLRSAKEVRGYHIQGADDSIGHVADFVFDDKSWQVRYLVVNASAWWFGKKVLVAHDWVERVAWDEKTVHIGLTRKMIEDAPEWNENAAVNREYEERLYDYHGRPVYW